MGKKADTYTVKYFLNEPSKREKTSNRKSSSNTGNGKSAEVSFREALVEHKINWLAKLDPASAESAELFAELTSESSKADQVQVNINVLMNFLSNIQNLNLIKEKWRPFK